MNITPIIDEGQTLPYPQGKVLGIVDSPAALERVSEALESIGLTENEVLSGEDGIRLLERDEGFFLSDVHDIVIMRYVKELKDGHYLVAIKVPPERVDEVVEIASEHGVRNLIRFTWAAAIWL